MILTQARDSQQQSGSLDLDRDGKSIVPGKTCLSIFTLVGMVFNEPMNGTHEWYIFQGSDEEEGGPYLHLREKKTMCHLYSLVAPLLDSNVYATGYRYVRQ